MHATPKVWAGTGELGRRDVNCFSSTKVTIREVNDIDEGKKLINSILAMVAQKQLLKEQLNE